jgi:hypothetical protein
MSDDQPLSASQQAEADKAMRLLASKAIDLSRELLMQWDALRSTAEQDGADSRDAQIQALAVMRLAQPLAYLRIEDQALQGKRWPRLKTVNPTLTKDYEKVESKAQDVCDKAQLVYSMRNRKLSGDPKVSGDPKLTKDIAESKQPGFWEPGEQLKAALVALQESLDAKPASTNRGRRQGQRLSNEEVRRNREILKIEKSLGLKPRAVGNTQRIIDACKELGLDVTDADIRKARNWEGNRKRRRSTRRPHGRHTSA